MATPIGSNRVLLDARTAAEVTGGRVVRATEGRTARGVTTDSRAVEAGGAFVALRGTTHDGHSFTSSAIDTGARLVVVERGRAPTDPRADAVEVEDTLVAWGAIAKTHLREWRKARPEARVVGITGSAGKTTTKELCAALLRQMGDCHASAGNLNNRVGLPAVALEVEPRHRFAVLEMGMSIPGEIAALASIAEPDVGVVVNVGLAHAGGVGGTVDDVAREKGALFEGVRPHGTMVANADDGAVMAQAERTAGRHRVTFGRADRAVVRLVSRESLGADGSRVVVERSGRRTSFTVPIAGEAASLDFLAALAAAEAAAGPLDDASVVAGLASLGPITGRMHVQVAGGVQVIDDAYNANPASMRAALATLVEMRAERRLAVLGEMKELGPAAESEHEALGEAVALAGVALFVSCGGLADMIGRAAARRGVEVIFAADAERASHAVLERVRPGDVVLVKASRSVGAERVVRDLLAPRGRG
jgi:UDP-N-acetylmuramoyl-tripeptide--D-alanyl-D-alanine ligase